MCDHHQLRPSGGPAGVIDHVSSLSDNLGELVENSEYSDITLLVENRKFPAHKVILAARSEYFRYIHKAKNKYLLFPHTTRPSLKKIALPQKIFS